MKSRSIMEDKNIIKTINPATEEILNQYEIISKEEISELARENEEFIEKLRRINPEGRKRKEKELRDFLFGRIPQNPEQEK